MSLSLSDVNKKVRNKLGPRCERLLGLTADHKTAFVEWDSVIPSQRTKESVPSQNLEIVEEVGTENAGGGELFEQHSNRGD